MKEKTDAILLTQTQDIDSNYIRLSRHVPFRDLFSRYAKICWKFFTSIKLSVILLLSLAGTSIIGTFIPQNAPPEKYLEAFGDFLFRLFNLFNLFDMYHSGWFQILIILLALNITICSIDRLSATWKIIFKKNLNFNPSRFINSKSRLEYNDRRSPENLRAICESTAKRTFNYVQSEDVEGGGFLIFAEKWRKTRLGVHLVHLGVLSLLVGSLIGSLFGFEGYVNIPEGGSVNSIRLRGSGLIQPLDFTIHCEDFNVSFYETGMPKEFRSDLSIIEAGRTVAQKKIIVNSPLRYSGINIFQSSYAPLPPTEAVLTFTDTKSALTFNRNVQIGQSINLPNNRGIFTLKAYREGVEFKGQNIGNAFLGSLASPGGSPLFVLLPIQYPSFDKMRKGELAISVSGYKDRYYTGLQVTKDPGVPFVYAGFIFMVLGCIVTFFMPHQQLCISVRPDSNGSRVMIAGKCLKQRLGMDNKINKIRIKLSDSNSNNKPLK